MKKNCIWKYFIHVFLVLIPGYHLAQKPTTWYNKNGGIWPSALAGGFIAPQFSMFDLTQDGQLELITFDRYSGIIQVWSRAGSTSTYILHTDTSIEWPDVQSWMLIRDFNQDQVPDIFTQGLHGIAVYKGIMQGDKLRFEKVTGSSFIDDSLLFQHQSGSKTNIYHNAADIPVIEDVDGDGDLDILTFELSGSYLYYYENQKNKTGKDFEYILRHNCWGYFAENLFSDEINISKNHPICPPPFSVRHAGSTSCLIDVNHDSLPDLILGDVGSNSLKILINKGSRDQAVIKQVEPFFPNEEDPAILHYFPAAFKLDINQDELDDIVIAVNEYPMTDDEGIWLYTGTGRKEQPFLFQTNQWLTDQYIDLGQYTSPLFIDINGDGVKDLLIGYQEVRGGHPPLNKIAYFEARSEREYQLRALNFKNLDETLRSGFRPYLTSGDVDGDGDTDILIGMSNGDCYLIENKSGNNHEFILGEIKKNWQGLRLLSGATPELFDIDGDGDLDIISGTDNGTIGLYLNTGTHTNAAFDSDLNSAPNVKQLGKIHTVNQNNLIGRSAPRIIIRATDTVLVSGSHGGNIFTYRVNSNDFNSKFDQITPEGWPNKGGGNGRMTVHQNQKKNFHFLMGNISGGLIEKMVPSVPTHPKDNPELSVDLYPNPVQRGDYIQVEVEGLPQITHFELFYPSGTLFRSIPITALDQYQFSTRDWLPGVYFLRIILKDRSSVIRKVIVQ